MSNQINFFIDGKLKTFKKSQRKKEIFDMQGGAMPTFKNVYGTYGNYNGDASFQLIEKKGIIYTYESCSHFNGHLSNYKKGVYEVFGKEVKGMTVEEFKQLEIVETY
jgi:hypothetical protein